MIMLRTFAIAFLVATISLLSGGADSSAADEPAKGAKSDRDAKATNAADAATAANAANVANVANVAKKIVLIAGKKSHGPEGNGIHDYPWSVKLLKVMLDHSNIKEQVAVEYHLNGWPADEKTLDDAATIMVISDGRDGNLYEEAPHFATKEHVATIRKQIERGCGFMTFHFSTFAPDEYAPEILEWSGGYFDWETEGKRQWYSAIQTLDTDVALPTADHPVARGVKPFKMKEEFYYNLRFHPGDTALKPLLAVPALPGREPDGRVVAWARERRDGGRGFGTTCGHFYDNWRNDAFRRMILNALCWTAKVEVPAEGVTARFFERDEIVAALADVRGAARSNLDTQPIKVLMFAGNQAHAWHNWQRTTPAIVAALERDRRVKVDVSQDIEDLAKLPLRDYQVIVQNYVNWHDPKSLSEPSRKAFVDYLKDGGGLVLVHFANGAWNFSLPMAGESDWPEYRKIVRRVWNHHGMGEAKSGHDAFGKFSVKPTALASPITAGLQPFEVTDELYFRQDGPDPVEPLITAKSKVTDRDEPLAWTYSYGKGRVFQTLLGHSEKTYDTFEPREMLRRAVAWCANRPPRQLDPSLDVVAANGAGANAGAGGGGAPAGTPANTPPAQLKLAEGRFGQALDTAVGGAHMAGKDEYRKPPLTLECWAKLKRQPGYHILAAQELKSSATHWEVFAMAGSGHLTVYLPGMNPDHVRSTVNIVDEQWHYLAMIYEPTRVRLFVDGKQVADTQVASKNGETVPGGLAIGQLVGREIGCDGLIDDVRLSRGVREIRGVPTAPLPVDEQTIGLWRFDHFDDRRAAPDESPLKNPGKVADAAAPGGGGGGGPKPTRAQQVADAARMNDHFGAASVGFNWTEQDSVDDRWNKTDVGPMLASTVPLPGVGVVRKGLSIRVGERGEGTFCYDTGQVACRAGWLDGFLKFNPARFGLISSPIPGGKVQFAVADGPGWESDAKDATPKYRGLHRQDQRSVVECEIAGAVVREMPWLESIDSLRVFTRAFEVGQRASGLRLRVGPVDGIRAALKREGQDVVVVERDADVVVFAIRGPASLAWDSPENGRFGVVVPTSESPVHFTVASVVAPKSDVARAVAAARSVAPVTATQFQQWLRPGPPIWTQPIVTRGVRAPDDGPYVLDSLTLPHDNPYRALMFASGHDFFRNGDIALSTAHGDVWRVSGVDASLQRLEWKRFATGLFQPLGLKIVDDVVYVLGRDQITRLVDRNGDGEADDYENFHSDIETSPGGHDYVACLETDSRGDFYLVHANQGVVRVSRDGRRSESIANGLRNPNGLGIGPGDVITAAPQEGNWTPGSCVFEVRQGGYYGFGGPRVTAQRPLGYDPPLCWIPRMQDNSSGGQVWVTSEKWGPLNGQLLHFSYGKCRMMQVLRDTTTGVSQGATLDFPIDFASGVMRGCFSPHDGQLYASGLKGWVSSAVQDGCLQRVRYTGRAVYRPVAFRTRANALELDFAAPLDKAFCEDPDNFHVQRWNYRYSGDYGSADFKLSDPKQEGRDEVEVRSSTVIADGRTLVLEIPDLKPAMQMSVEYVLRAVDGESLRNTVTFTLNRVSDEKFDESRFARRERRGQLPMEVVERLRPGLAVRTTQDSHDDFHVARMASLLVADGRRPTLRTSAGRFSTTMTGFVHVDLRSEFQFSLTGRGAAKLSLNGQTVLEATGDLSQAKSASAVLSRGHNAFRLEYVGELDAAVRVWWSSPDFAREPIPATALFHDSGDPQLRESLAWREGFWKYDELRCAACHESRQSEQAAKSTKSNGQATGGGVDRVGADRDGAARVDAARVDAARVDAATSPLAGPELSGIGQRTNRDWIAHWLLDPTAHRDSATMPRLLDAQRPSDRQTAVDIAAWLATLPASAASWATAASRTQETPGKVEPPSASGAAAENLSGEHVFEDLGCLGCHRLTPSDERDVHRRISLAGIGRKFSHDSLAQFLRRPQAHFAATRMPDFALSSVEATAIARYLLAASDLPDAKALGRVDLADVASKADPVRGKDAFAKLGCVQCHAIDTVAASSQPIRIQRLDAGCLASPVPTPAAAPTPNVTGTRGTAPNASAASAAANSSAPVVPRWNLTEDERAALRKIVATKFTAAKVAATRTANSASAAEVTAAAITEAAPESQFVLAPLDAAAETAARMIERLNCHACHTRDARVSQLRDIIAEESSRGIVPEPLPNLTWTGEKLQATWLRSQLAGDLPQRARPWLKARMPAFSRYSETLAAGLMAQHGLPFAPAQRDAQNPTTELIEAGKRLTFANGGLDCRQCHAVGAAQPTGDAGTRIAHGVNFALVGRRLQDDYYRRFLLDPPRYDISTKMPKLAVDGKKTKIADVFGGDAEKQFAAIWAYIKSLEAETR